MKVSTYDGLSLGVLSVGDRVSDDVLEAEYVSDDQDYNSRARGDERRRDQGDVEGGRVDVWVEDGNGLDFDGAQQ